MPLPGNELERVLIIRPQKIGDLVITLPAVDALRAANPGIAIDLIAAPRSIVVVRDDPRFETVVAYRKSRAFLSELQALRRRRYGCVLDMIDGDSVTGLLLSQLCAGKDTVRVGEAKFVHAPYYDIVSPPLGPPRSHGIERSLAVVEAVGVPIGEVSRFARPHLSPGDRAVADAFFGSGEGEPRIAERSTPRVGLNLSAGQASRRWPLDRARALLARLLEGHDVTVVLVTTPSERALAEAVGEGFGARVRLVPPNLTILEVSAIVSRLSVLITPDTSLVHIARALGVAVVGLYPSARWNLERWFPYGQSAGVVIAPSETEIRDIEPEEVIRAMDEVLERAKDASPAPR